MGETSSGGCRLVNAYGEMMNHHLPSCSSSAKRSSIVVPYLLPYLTHFQLVRDLGNFLDRDDHLQHVRHYFSGK
ncbi:hypothetical protein CEXT_449931 [Caerostris extrusa]|uniref:Uncharacterized protein n=1 Tax=Caerostris extrusa TaxID=172846 RepID=A0AAV4MPF4_CAEEX|nr:hypothetical protein CEXT_449931 [Caerostris extrusa]